MHNMLNKKKRLPALLIIVIFIVTCLLSLPAFAAADEYTADICDISFAGTGNASSFYFSSPYLTNGMNSMTIHHMILGADGKFTTVNLSSAKKTATDDGYIVIRDAKFTKMPAIGDIITLKNTTAVFSCQVTQTILNEFIGSAGTPAPAPAITYKGVGDNLKFTVKSPAKSTVYFYNKDKTIVTAKDMETKTSLSLSLYDIFDSNAAAVASSGMFYASCSSPAYGISSEKIVVYFPKIESPLAPTPGISNTSKNRITITAADIRNYSITIWAYGTDDSVDVNDYVSYSSTNTAILKFDVFMESEELFSSEAGLKKVQFTLSSDSRSESMRSRVLSMNYIPSETTDPANVRNESSPVVIKNNLGPADQIIIGELGSGTKVLLFALAPSQVGKADANAIESLKELTDIKSTGKYTYIDSTGKSVTITHPAYMGKSATGALNKDSTIKLDLSTYAGHNLLVYIIPKGSKEGHWASGIYKIPFENESQTITWGIKLSIYYVMGMTDDNFVIYGAKKGDIITLYSSTSGKTKSVTAADNYTVITKINMSDSFDQIGISRAGYKVLPRSNLNLPVHEAGTVSEKISVTIGTIS